MPSVSSEKLLGWVLLAIGILIIIVSTLSAYRVMTGAVQPPKVLDVPAPAIKLPQAQPSISLPEGIELPAGVNINQLQATPAEVKLLPDDVFSRLLNTSLFYLAMMFVATSGLKFSDIGVKLVKDIKVEVKENKIPS